MFYRWMSEGLVGAGICIVAYARGVGGKEECNGAYTLLTRDSDCSRESLARCTFSLIADISTCESALMTMMYVLGVRTSM